MLTLPINPVFTNSGNLSPKLTIINCSSNSKSFMAIFYLEIRKLKFFQKEVSVFSVSLGTLNFVQLSRLCLIGKRFLLSIYAYYYQPIAIFFLCKASIFIEQKYSFAECLWKKFCERFIFPEIYFRWVSLMNLGRNN